MRIGIIRGDIPGPICLMDLETISQYDPPVEPRGQERRFDRPNATLVGNVVATLPAAVIGTTDITSGATINAGNRTLKVKVAVGAYTTVLVATAVYATGATLLAAVNAALVAAGVGATARYDNTLTYMVLQSTTLGVGSYIEIDSVGGGSTFNTPVGFAIGGDTFTMPAVSTVITALLPVGGPLDVSVATMSGLVGPGPRTGQFTALADSIAPHFVETDVVIKSFQVGMIRQYRNALYNPDPNRLPNGAAITVVQDDGVSLFTAPLTVISGAVHDAPNAGDITITGTNLGDVDIDATIVRVTSADGANYVKLYQQVIRTTLTGGTQGVVAPVSIVIPASLLLTITGVALGVVGSTVRVQYTSLGSNLFTVT